MQASPHLVYGPFHFCSLQPLCETLLPFSDRQGHQHILTCLGLSHYHKWLGSSVQGHHFLWAVQCAAWIAVFVQLGESLESEVDFCLRALCGSCSVQLNLATTTHSLALPVNRQALIKVLLSVFSLYTHPQIQNQHLQSCAHQNWLEDIDLGLRPGGHLSRGGLAFQNLLF